MLLVGYARPRHRGALFSAVLLHALRANALCFGISLLPLNSALGGVILVSGSICLSLPFSPSLRFWSGSPAASLSLSRFGLFSAAASTSQWDSLQLPACLLWLDSWFCAATTLPAAHMLSLLYTIAIPPSYCMCLLLTLHFLLCLYFLFYLCISWVGWT